MAFDISTAHPLEESPAKPDGFDISTAKPVQAAPQPSRKDAILSTLAIPPSNMSVARNAIVKGVAGTADMFLNAPNRVVNLGKAAVGSIANASGRSDLAPDITSDPNYANMALTKIGLIRPEDEPVTPSQRILDAGVQGATGMVLGGGYKTAGQMLSNAAAGGIASGVGQATTESTGNSKLGLAASLAASAAIPMLGAKFAANTEARQAELNAQKSLNAERDAIMQNALDSGIKIAPSDVKNRGMAANALASQAGKVAMEGKASANNAPIIHNMVAKELGAEANTPLTPDVLDEIRGTAFDAGYAPLRGLGTIATDADYKAALDKLKAPEVAAGKSFPVGAKSDIQEIVSQLDVPVFDSSHAIDKIRELRATSDKAFNAKDNLIGTANKEAANILEDAIESHLKQSGQEQLLNDYRNARSTIAKTYTVEPAINKATGLVNPAKLATIYQSKKGSVISGDIKNAAEISKAFPKSTKNTDIADGHGISALNATEGAAAGLGTLLLGHNALASIAAAAAPMLASAGARKIIMSDKYQKGQMPNYTANNALSGLDMGASGAAKLAALSTIPVENNSELVIDYAKEIKKKRKQ